MDPPSTSRARKPTVAVLGSEDGASRFGREGARTTFVTPASVVSVASSREESAFIAWIDRVAPGPAS